MRPGFIMESGKTSGLQPNRIVSAGAVSQSDLGVRKNRRDAACPCGKRKRRRLCDRRKADDPQNLVAKKEGTVVRIITRNGIPQVLPGDTCQAGDILVKGEIPLVNDSGETYDYSYVHADADIDLETTWYYYDTFPLSHTVRTYQKAEKKSRYSRFLLTDFSLEICCRRILWRVCGA